MLLKTLWSAATAGGMAVPAGTLAGVAALALVVTTTADTLRAQAPAAGGAQAGGAAADSARAGDWPAFRGPSGDGHSSERGLPTEWSESRNIVWKAPVAGQGWSSPAISGDRVWLTTATGQGDVVLRAIALDVASGRQVADVELFRIGSGGARHQKNTWASPTPIVHGDRVYVHFGPNGTAALTTAGEILWKTRLDYQPQHGAGGSPALHGDLLIVNCDGNDVAYVVALDARTGKVRWKTPRREPVSQAYTTPLVIRAAGRDQVISVGAHQTMAYDPASGKELWRVDYGDGFSNVPRPVYGHGLVYITTGFFQPKLMAIRADGAGDVTGTHVAWTLGRGVPLTPSPLLVGDELFIVSDNGIATCLDAKTGAVLWQQRLGGNYSASPVFADGRIYFLSEDGVVTVIEPGRSYRQLASNTLNGATLASMAIARGSIFIRTDTHLYRIAETR